MDPVFRILQGARGDGSLAARTENLFRHFAFDGSCIVFGGFLKARDLSARLNQHRICIWGTLFSCSANANSCPKKHDLGFLFLGPTWFVGSMDCDQAKTWRRYDSALGPQVPKFNFTEASAPAISILRNERFSPPAITQIAEAPPKMLLNATQIVHFAATISPKTWSVFPIYPPFHVMRFRPSAEPMFYRLQGGIWSLRAENITF